MGSLFNVPKFVNDNIKIFKYVILQQERTGNPLDLNQKYHLHVPRLLIFKFINGISFLQKRNTQRCEPFDKDSKRPPYYILKKVQHYPLTLNPLKIEKRKIC